MQNVAISSISIYLLHINCTRTDIYCVACILYSIMSLFCALCILSQFKFKVTDLNVYLRTKLHKINLNLYTFNKYFPHLFSDNYKSCDKTSTQIYENTENFRKVSKEK